MFKEIGQFKSLMKQALEMQGRMEEMQGALRRLRVEGMAGGGLVVVEMNGQQQVVSCRIDPGLVSAGDHEMIEDLVVSAANQALEKVKEAASTELQKLTGGINLAGLNDMLAHLSGGVR